MIQQIKRVILRSTENEFERIMGNSSCKKPYQTHKERPEISTNNITHEMSSAFFSFKTFINCGSIAAEVKIPATIPKTFSFIAFNSNRNEDKNFRYILEIYLLFDRIKKNS